MVRVVSMAAAYFSAVILAGLVCLICVNVGLRYIFGSPIIWVDQITGYGMVYITFLGAPLVVAKRAHISVDVLQVALGPRGQLMLGVLVGGVVSLYCAFFAFLSWKEMGRILDRNLQFSDAVILPQWTVYWVLIAGSVLMALHFALQTYDDLRNYTAGREVDRKSTRDIEGQRAAELEKQRTREEEGGRSKELEGQRDGMA